MASHPRKGASKTYHKHRKNNQCGNNTDHETGCSQASRALSMDKSQQAKKDWSGEKATANSGRRNEPSPSTTHRKSSAERSHRQANRTEYGYDSRQSRQATCQNSGGHGSRHKRRWRKGPSHKDRRAVQEVQTPGNNGQADNLEIPGFYYDQEKKKYFKILPGQTNAGTSVITRDVVSAKKAEEKRQTDLKASKYASDSGQDNCDRVCKRVLTKLTGSQLKEACSSNVCILDHMQRGTVRSFNFRCGLSRRRVKALQHCGHAPAMRPTDAWFNTIEHMKYMFPIEDGRKLLCLLNRIGSPVFAPQFQLQVIEVQNITRVNEQKDFQIDLKTVCDVKQYWNPNTSSVVSDMCVTTKETSHNILFVCPLNIPSGGSMAFLNFLNSDSSGSGSWISQPSHHAFAEMIWSCAWNSHRPLFSLGCEGRSILVEASNTRSRSFLPSNDSNVLAQAFSEQTGDILYSGTRNGAVLAHDLRQTRKNPSFKMQPGKGVNHIYCSPDDYSLIVSGFFGKISKWDLRQRKLLLEYEGHRNQFRKLPFHICEQEQLLYAVGDDSYTRFWCEKTGELLCSLPPPYPASKTNIPAVYYSPQMGRKSAYPGLLMGIRDEIHLYT